MVVMSEVRGSSLYAVVREVRPLVLNSVRVVEAGGRGNGLSVGMRAVLEVLAEAGAVTVPELASRLELARQGVQRLVNELVGLGYVEVRDNPRHRRSVLIAVTPAGDGVFSRLRAAELEQLGGMAVECSPGEIAAAAKVLRALNRDVRKRALELGGAS
jgi:DNA-binding MarR family transcriptional regulator